MSKIVLAISLMGFFLSACAATAKILPASKVIFITATSGLPKIQPTDTYSSTLTPLPGQVYAMTQDAKITPDLHTRVVMIAQTYTPTQTPTRTMDPAHVTETAIAKEREAAMVPTVACHPEYPDFCIPYNHRKTCKEWNALGYTTFTVRKPDSFNYDKNADGIGCND